MRAGVGAGRTLLQLFRREAMVADSRVVAVEEEAVRFGMFWRLSQGRQEVLIQGWGLGSSGSSS